MKTTQIVLASRPVGMPTKDNFRFEEIDLPPLENGKVLLKPHYISVDPYMRGRMNDEKSYVPPFQLGKPIEGGVVALVKESKSNAFNPGDYVMGNLPWAKDLVVDDSLIRNIDTQLAPPEYYLGLLGMPGLTAYFGLLDIGQPHRDETVVVSGAAGAVGSVVGQLAKLKGCKVVGIAGSDAKIKLMKEKFGYDEGINYKTTKDLSKALKDACPNGVDVYFDNVGGEITDAVITKINFHARIVLCGQIALYNEREVPMGPRFLPLILTRSALIKGFIVSNYSSRFSSAYKELAAWVKNGDLQFEETTVHGFENLPDAFFGLFTGENKGKMLVKV